MQRLEARDVVIKAVHAEVKARYGSPGVHAELVTRGKSRYLNTAAGLTRERGLATKMQRKLRCTTDSTHGRPVTENLVDRQFAPAAADEVWPTDIIYLATCEGWLYLASVEDLH